MSRYNKDTEIFSMDREIMLKYYYRTIEVYKKG